MKRKLYGFIWFLTLLNFSGCKYTEMIQETQTESNILQTESNDLNALSISTNFYDKNVSTKTEEPGEPKIEVISEIYALNQEKNGTLYFVILQEDWVPFYISAPDLVNDPVYKDVELRSFAMNRLMRLLDAEGNQVQIISLDCSTFGGIYFEDVNRDGYLDIVVKTGGTWNETHELFIWDTSNQNFTKVIFEGFDMLAFFSVYDGYIDNFLRGSSPEDSIKMKLVWRGNMLIKEKEY